jgi:hypothetical protein
VFDLKEIDKTASQYKCKGITAFRYGLSHAECLGDVIVIRDCDNANMQ